MLKDTEIVAHLTNKEIHMPTVEPPQPGPVFQSPKTLSALVDTKTVAISEPRLFAQKMPFAQPETILQFLANQGVTEANKRLALSIATTERPRKTEKKSEPQITLMTDILANLIEEEMWQEGLKIREERNRITPQYFETSASKT